MMILNPLANELFVPVALSFAGLLSVGFLGVLGGMGATRDKELRQQLILRWSSWSVIAIVSLTAVLSGTWIFACLASLVAVVCVVEYCKITQLRQEQVFVLCAAGLIMPTLAAFSAAALQAGFLAFALLYVIMCMSRESGMEKAALGFLCLAYVPLLVSYSVLLQAMSSFGSALLLTVVCASALANIFAFVFGKLLKGPKLAPSISPNKTWWGVLGSFCGSYFGFLLLLAATQVQLPAVLVMVVPSVVALAGIAGDLFESFLKRSGKVKDAGKWLPGFGGALDRVDGLLFVIPAVYYLVLPVL